MKVIIKTCKGANFEIEVEPEDTVVEVKITESTEGADVYPAVQLRLIPQGKVLKDETTLEENKVAENSSFVVTTKPSSGGASTASAAPPTQTKPSSAGASVASAAPPTQREAMGFDRDTVLEGLPNPGADTFDFCSILDLQTLRWKAQSDPQMLQHTLEMLVERNPHLMRFIQERDPDFFRLINEREGNVLGDLASAVPQSVSVVTPEEREAIDFVRDTVLEGLPSVAAVASADTLDWLLNNLHFQPLRGAAQANPQSLQPMLLEPGKLNLHSMRFLQPDFLRLINEREGNVLGDLASAVPQSASVVTPEEREAIDRLVRTTINKLDD